MMDWIFRLSAERIQGKLQDDSPNTHFISANEFADFSAIRKYEWTWLRDGRLALVGKRGRDGAVVYNTETESRLRGRVEEGRSRAGWNLLYSFIIPVGVIVATIYWRYYVLVALGIVATLTGSIGISVCISLAAVLVGTLAWSIFQEWEVYHWWSKIRRTLDEGNPAPERPEAPFGAARPAETSEHLR
jgi:hypothetical protein